MAIDLSRYVDLTFYDLSPQQIYELALANLRASLPEWIPREGNVENLVLEGMALEVSELITAINRVPSAVAQIIMQLHGISRDYGSQPTTTITFELSNLTGHDIPARTRLRLIPDGYLPIIFSTDVALAIPAGQTLGTVSATGDRYTDDGNGIVAGTVVEILDSLSYVNQAHLASEVVDGADPEEDEQWMSRAMQRLSRLSDSLVLPSHFVAAAMEDPNVERALALDNYNPDSGNAPGIDAGHITVAVYGMNAMVGADTKAALEELMESQCQSNLAVHVIDPTISTQDISVTVIKDTLAVTGDVISAVTNVLSTYLSTQSWPWDDTIRRNQLIAYIAGSGGVAYVSTLTLPETDITLPGYANLVEAGVINVTVLNP